ncbi:guanine-1-methyltransferase-domain-containing protein [Pisolithus orientalis]|uniref:guanine-1-methyltransferase-domain-containing protein n=1 Tax=Pisolithus orientalis TaxID=936130 RepID=UPI002223FF3B|nr:guanine-1-methyltransferase-domain-containing protein [Pisolithus orientalis]KAI6034942.1 guanine-1-methyltransferase-domain-containing protein [Pisolithus orientalis]
METEDIRTKPEEERVTPSQGLSKKAQKRAAKAARLHELKLERRARERETKKRKQAGARPGCSPFNARLVIDLGFDELMTDKEINSLTSQLAYTYSTNRRAPHAFSSLLFTSINGRTKERLDAMNDAGYRRWSNTEWWEESYERIWTRSLSPSQSPSCEPTDAPAADSTSTETDTTADADELRKSVVYFTADSENEILELKEGETYVIGGICDHNRYKNLCLNKANASQIRHARLPIGRYIALATRKVLTVNQVVEILLKWVETRDWEEAFWAVIPKRKFQGIERVSPKDDDSTTNEVRDGSEPSGHAKKESSAGLEGHSSAPVGEGGGDFVSDSGGEG